MNQAVTRKYFRYMQCIHCLIGIALLLCRYTSLSAQNNGQLVAGTKQSVYGEFSGPAIWGSLNYEIEWIKIGEKARIANSIGFSYYHNPDPRYSDENSSVYYAPLRAYFLFGNSPHIFVAGFALNIQYVPGERIRLNHSKSALIPTPYIQLGYRFQNVYKGFFIQGLVYPFFKGSILRWTDCWNNCLGYRNLQNYYLPISWGPSSPPHVKLYLKTLMPVVGISVGYTFPAKEKSK